MNSDRNSDVDTPLFLVNGEVFPEGEQDENRLAAGAITDGDDISDVSNDSNIEQAAESSDERKPSKLTVQSARITVDDDAPLTALAVTPTTAADPFPLPTGPIDKSVKFQLIPISDTPGRHAVGEVVERRLGDGRMMQLGRQVVKDGQPVVKGNKKSTEVDVWFTSKVVSRLHAEMWVKNGTLYIKDVGSSSGTFLNKMRLSPCGKLSRPYPCKEGDVIQLGVDYKGKKEDIYKSMTMKIGFFDQTWVQKQRKQFGNNEKFSAALGDLLSAANPYGTTGDKASTTSPIECCICIGNMSTFQALFISPCSHCYHFKCVASMINQSAMFQCPLCRQVANLTASVSSDSLHLAGNEDVGELYVEQPIVEEGDSVVPEPEAIPSSAHREKRMSLKFMSRVFGRRASHQEDSTEQAASHQAAPASAAAVHAPSRRERAASLSARLNMFIRPDSSRRPSAEHASEMDGQVPEEIA